MLYRCKERQKAITNVKLPFVNMIKCFCPFCWCFFHFPWKQVSFTWHTTPINIYIIHLLLLVLPLTVGRYSKIQISRYSLCCIILLSNKFPFVNMIKCCHPFCWCFFHFPWKQASFTWHIAPINIYIIHLLPLVLPLTLCINTQII